MILGLTKIFKADISVTSGGRPTIGQTVEEDWLYVGVPHLEGNIIKIPEYNTYGWSSEVQLLKLITGGQYNR